MEKQENQKRRLSSDLNMSVMLCVEKYVITNVTIHRKREMGKIGRRMTVLRRGVLGIAALLPPFGI